MGVWLSVHHNYFNNEQLCDWYGAKGGGLIMTLRCDRMPVDSKYFHTSRVTPNKINRVACWLQPIVAVKTVQATEATEDKPAGKK